MRHRIHHPLQIWLPALNYSPLVPRTRRDILRACQLWNGEHRVWFLPGLKEPRSWCRDLEGLTFRESAVPSESFDRVDVIHVETDGRAYVPARDRKFLKDNGYRLPARLYQTWLNSGFSLLLGHPYAIQMEVPVFYSDRRVGFKTRKLRTAPTSTCHLRIGKDGRSIIGEWPPPDADLPKSVSPEAESEIYYGPLQYDPDKRLDFGDIQVPLITSPTNPDVVRSLPTRLQWDSPFDEFLPFGGGLDAMYAHAKFRRFAERGLTGKIKLNEITAEAEPYLSEAESTWEKTWFLPRLAADGDRNALWDLATAYDVDHPDLDSVWDDPAYRALASKPVTVTRIWSWIGYFWWEFLADFKAGRNIRGCMRCGRVISGSKRKGYCNRADNPDCFRARRSKDRREERSRSRIRK